MPHLLNVHCLMIFNFTFICNLYITKKKKKNTLTQWSKKVLRKSVEACLGLSLWSRFCGAAGSFGLVSLPVQNGKSVCVILLSFVVYQDL